MKVIIQLEDLNTNSLIHHRINTSIDIINMNIDKFTDQFINNTNERIKKLNTDKINLINDEIIEEIVINSGKIPEKWVPYIINHVITSFEKEYNLLYNDLRKVINLKIYDDFFNCPCNN